MKWKRLLGDILITLGILIAAAGLVALLFISIMKYPNIALYIPISLAIIYVGSLIFYFIHYDS